MLGINMPTGNIFSSQQPGFWNRLPLLLDLIFGSLLRSLFISVWERGWESSASLRRALVAGVGGYFGHDQDRGVVVFSLTFLRGFGVYVSVCQCVYTHELAHTARRVLGCEPQGSGRDIWRARRIQMDWILGCIYLCTCTKYTCIYICAGRRDEILV